MIYLFIGITSYTVGCICGGYYLTRLLTGQDLRTLGSTTLGARNAGRVLGKKGAILTFTIDLLKGYLVIFLVQKMADTPTITAIAFFCVVLGHIYPAQLKFQGGKGLATMGGATLALSPLAFFIALLVGSVLVKLKCPTNGVALGILLAGLVLLSLTVEMSFALLLSLMATATLVGMAHFTRKGQNVHV